MNVDEFVETLSRFIGGIAERDPGTAAQMRRIEIDLDAEGIVKVTTDVGAGLISSRQGPVPSSEPEPAVHVDVAVAADWLGVDDSRWCHGTVDTDCLLRVLVEESLGGSTWSGRLGQVFETLSVDRDRLLAELARIRPSGGSRHFPITVASGDGGWVGQRTPTGRFVLVVYRVLRSKEPAAVDAGTPVEVLHSLLMEDQGPAAEALEQLGMSPGAARELLGLPEARPVEGGTMWPPAPNPREFSWPNDRHGPLPYLEPPPPSAGTTPSSFVWTSSGGQELELSAVRNGPIRIRARSASEASVDLDAHTAEILARHLMDFHAQLEAERWEPIFDAEAHGRPKPPPPNP